MEAAHTLPAAVAAEKAPQVLLQHPAQAALVAQVQNGRQVRETITLAAAAAQVIAADGLAVPAE